MSSPWPSGTPTDPRQDDWTSPLWGDPGTQAATWPTTTVAAPEVPATPTPPAPQGPSKRALMAAGAAVLVALLVLGALVTGAIPRHSSQPTAANTPNITAPLTPSTAPSTPGFGGSNGSGSQSQGGSGQGSTGQGGSDQNGLGQGGTGSQGQGSQGQGSQGQGSTGQGGSGSQSQNGGTSTNAAAAAVTPGLVDIVSSIGYDGSEGAGTGIILSSDGLVLTNHHVVAGSTSMTVTVVATGKTYHASVLGYDATHDIAVIKLADASGLTVAPLGDSSTVKIGDDVVGVGNAGGVGGTPSVATGTVTGLNKSITAQDEADGTSEQLSGLIETDAGIQAGDSGGALASSDGKIIGVITAGAESNSFQSTASQGFAVPINTASAIAKQIIAGKSSSTVHIGGSAFLGVSIATNGFGGASVNGVPVAAVTPGTAADKAGIVSGSVITALGGQTVSSADALHTALTKHHPGDKVSVSWTDPFGNSHTETVTLGEGPVG
ncbi:MAG TPA: trypsin-like peptidase domain-containing protein [Actinomycetes bacterium]|nr:trypsin-like peptidase domain-containing protein [Actinomycetes bacterium]